MKGMRDGRRPIKPLAGVALLSALALALAFSLPGNASTASKVPTANPTFVRGTLWGGSYLNVQTSDNSYMRIRETRVGGIRYIDTRWQNWQLFSEASRTKLLDIRVELEGQQSNAGDSWYAQFYNFDSGAWDTTWYLIGSLPTTQDGTLQINVGNAARARTFVDAGGRFYLRLADQNTAQGGGDGTATILSIDLLRATFVYDITPPTSSVTSPTDMQYTNAHVFLVTGTSSDPAPDAAGVSAVDVSTDGGGTWNPAVPAAPGDYSAWSYSWSVPAEGTYNIRSRATDAVNNAETPGSGVRVVVDWTPPQVTGVSPAPGSTNVGVDVVITATLSDNHGILPSSVNTSTFTLRDEEGTPVAGTVNYDTATGTASFRPDSALFYGYTYTATLTTGISDLAGNGLLSDYSWSFRTADILTLSLTGTYNRDGTPGGGGVDFGVMSPEGSPYIVGGGVPPYAAGFRVLSSTRWNLFLRATSHLTDGTQTPPASIPISQLAWRLSGAPGWTPFALSDTAVFPISQNRTPQPGGSLVNFDLRLELTWDDLPGQYGTTVVFLLMVQP